MNKTMKKAVAGLMAAAVLTGASCMVATRPAEAADLQSRVASIMSNEEQVSLAFYLDSDGYSNCDQKVIDQVVASIQAKLPAYAKLNADPQLLGNFDLFREEKQNEMLEKMMEENPTAYAMMSQQATVVPVQGETQMVPTAGMVPMYTNHSNGTRAAKMPLSKKLIKEFLETTPYDGLVIVRIDKVSEQFKQNYVPFVIGGNVKVEMDVTTRVFNKNSEVGYVFQNRQRVIGKVHGAFDSSIAIKRAMPEALNNIGEITVK